MMSNKKTIYELTRAVLEEEAPDEIFLLDEWSVNEQHGTSGGPQGFGPDDLHAGILLLPILWRFFDSFISELGKEVGKGSAEYIRKAIKTKMGRQDDSITTNKQMADLAQIVSEELKSQQIDAEKRKRVSVAIAKKIMKLIK